MTADLLTRTGVLLAHNSARTGRVLDAADQENIAAMIWNKAKRIIKRA